MSTEEQAPAALPVQLIKIADIDVPLSRIRIHYDEEDLEGLKETIERVGLINPITVYPVEERFELSAGFRRLMVFKELKRSEIPAHVIQASLSDRVALIENIQREGLHPLDEAEALYGLRRMEGCSMDGLARLVGKSLTWVSNTLSLRSLPDEVKEDVDSSIAKNALAELTKIKDPDTVLLAWKEIKAAGGTVAAARQIVSHYLYPIEERGADEGVKPQGKGGRSRRVYFRSLLKHGESVQRGLRELEVLKLGREKAPHLVKMLLELQEAVRAKLEELAQAGQCDIGVCDEELTDPVGS